MKCCTSASLEDALTHFAELLIPNSEMKSNIIMSLKTFRGICNTKQIKKAVYTLLVEILDLQLYIVSFEYMQ